MKALIVLLALVVSVFAARAQQISEIIKSRKIVLQHEGQEDSLVLPVVSDKYPALKKALAVNKLLNEDSLDEIVQEYTACGCGITSFNYQIVFWKAPVISIRVSYEFMRAYPSGAEDWYTLNINTGKPVSLRNEMSAAGLKWISGRYKAKLKQRILTGKRSNSGDDDAEEVYPKLIKAADTLSTNAIISNYIFGEKGITFTSDPVLPHVVESYEPNREVFFSYQALKAYIKPGSAFLGALILKVNKK